MAHPPPPPGPPPETVGPLGQGQDAFRLAVYHFRRRNVRNVDGGNDYVRQYIYKSAWYRSELEACMLQAEIKTFLHKLGMLGLILSFTYWQTQKLSEEQRAIARSSTRLAMGSRGATDGTWGYQGAERVQPDLRWATEGRALSISSGSLESWPSSSS